jgi:hypothetical protein
MLCSAQQHSVHSTCLIWWHHTAALTQIRELVLGAGHPSTANTLDSLGGVLLGLGEAVEAEKLISRALHSAQEVQCAAPLLKPCNILS